MTATPVTSLTAPLDASPRSESRRAVTAGTRGTLAATIGYVAAWIAGLTVFASSTQVNANGGQVVRALAGHQFAAGLQYALTEGVTALCLIAVIWAVTGNTRRGPARPTIRLAALAATVVSLAEARVRRSGSGGRAPPGRAAH